MTESLSDKIAGILNAAPKTFDPEDDVHDETAARVETGNGDDLSEDEQLLSSFRKQNLDLLEDVDKRYEGKKSSRKNLGVDDWSSSDELDEDSLHESDDSAGDDHDNSDDQDQSSEDSKSEEEYASGTSSSNDEDNSSYGDDNSENNDSFKHLKSDSTSQISKGFCVRQQLNMWESLLEIRIQLQKCLVTANKLPQVETFSELKEKYGSQFATAVTESEGHVSNLLEKLLFLQLLFLNKYPETKHILSEKQQSKPVIESDEEIPSDTDDEQSEARDSNEEVPRKKRKISDYSSDLNKRFDLYKEYRNSVIQKWDDKTRIATNKSGSTHSVVNQIDHILNDKEKLVKRTQLKRTDYEIVGEKSKENSHNQNSEASEEYNANVFDDTDFYHHLLRELIEFKSADITDPVQLSRQWIQLQNLRSKMKRKIDTKATKGRKIRYAVHSKLVNFMAPIEENMWQEEAKTELFNSLFGKNQSRVTI